MGFSGGLSKENRRRHSLNSRAIYQLILAGSIHKPVGTPMVQGLRRIMHHHRIAATRKTAKGGPVCHTAMALPRQRSTHAPLHRITTPA